MTHRRLHLGLALLLGMWAFSTRGQAQDIDPMRYAQVKAGYLLNFVRLTQWPDAAFEDERSPIVITVVGDDAMLPYLRELIRDELVNDRSVVLRRLEYPRPPLGEYDVSPELMEQFERAIRVAHLLYVARDERARMPRIVEIVEELPVLTASDIPRFAERGGMLGLALRDNRVGIDAHAARIRKSGLTVSSRLLRLARIVDDGEHSAR